MIRRVKNVVVGYGALSALKKSLDSFKAHRIGIVTSKQVEASCGRLLESALGNAYSESIHLFYVDDGEKAKRLETVEEVWRRMIESGFTRKSVLIGFGGGSVCDIAGFVAATYNRGLSLILVPTTLLAQVDAAIGGKNGIDFQGKNIIGTFYHPFLIVADTGFLETLSEREFRNGLAESVKVAVISDAKLFGFIKENSRKIFAREGAVLEELVRRSVAAKLKIVEKDEKEQDLRRILNFGHTFGHAFESLSGYSVSHGEAVSMGMVVVCRIAEKKIGFRKTRKVVCLLERFNLPVKPQRFDTRDVIEEIMKDKKAWFGKPQIVMPEEIGRGRILELSFEELAELYEEIGK